MTSNDQTNISHTSSITDFAQERQHYQKKIKGQQSIIDGQRRTIEKLQLLNKGLKTQRIQSDDKNIKLYDQVKQLKNLNQSLNRKIIDLRSKVSEMEINHINQVSFLQSSIRSTADNEEIRQLKAFNQRLIDQNIKLKQKIGMYNTISIESKQSEQMNQKLDFRSTVLESSLEKQITKQLQQKNLSLQKKNSQLAYQIQKLLLQNSRLKQNTNQITKQVPNNVDAKLKEQVKYYKKETQQIKKLISEKDKQIEQFVKNNIKNQQEKTKLMDLLNIQIEKRKKLKEQCEKLIKNQKMNENAFIPEDQLQGLIYKFHQFVKHTFTTINQMQTNRQIPERKNGRVAVKNVMKQIIDQQFRYMDNN